MSAISSSTSLSNALQKFDGKEYVNVRTPHYITSEKPQEKMYPEIDFQTNNISLTQVTIPLPSTKSCVKLNDVVPQMLALKGVTLVLPRAIPMERWFARISRMDIAVGGNQISLPLSQLHAFIATRPDMHTTDADNNYIELLGDFSSAPINLAVYHEIDINYVCPTPVGLSLSARITYIDSSTNGIREICDGKYDNSCVTEYKKFGEDHKNANKIRTANNESLLLFPKIPENLQTAIDELVNRMYITRAESTKSYTSPTGSSMRVHLELRSRVYEVIFYDSVDYSDFLGGNTVEITDIFKNCLVTVPVTRYTTPSERTYYKVQFCTPDNFQYDVVTGRDQYLAFNTVRHEISVCLINILPQINTTIRGMFGGMFSY